MKKQILTLLLCVVFLLPTSGFSEVFADDASVFQCENFSYALRQDGSAEIVKAVGSEALVIPSSLDGHPVVAIRSGAFENGRGIQSISLPDSILELEGNPFSSCSTLEKLLVSPEHSTLAVVDGVLFSKADKRLVCFPAELFTNFYTVPDGTEEIGEKAFFNSKHLVSVTVPGSVSRIGESAFSACPYLETAVLSGGVEEIGDYAFHLCENLRRVTVPDSVTVSGRFAFLGCYKLTDLTLPKNIPAIGEGAFLQVPLQQGG